MRLIIGGQAQGKLALARAETPGAQGTDGETCTLAEASRAQVLDHLHLLVRRALQAGETENSLLRWAASLRETAPDAVILCDEVGCGVVPIEKEERDYREAVGRISCLLAERASSVERIYCGLVTELKPEGKA